MAQQELDKDTERQIFEAMLETFGFRETEQGVTCIACSKRFFKISIGTPLNERMIRHFQEKHERIGVK